MMKPELGAKVVTELGEDSKGGMSCVVTALGGAGGQEESQAPT